MDDYVLNDSSLQYRIFRHYLWTTLVHGIQPIDRLEDRGNQNAQTHHRDDKGILRQKPTKEKGDHYLYRSHRQTPEERNVSKEMSRRRTSSLFSDSPCEHQS